MLDSVGVGALPDAAAYGDEGSSTLANLSRVVPLRLPTLAALGLTRIVDLRGHTPCQAPHAAFGKMAEASAGKDSVTGHWELMGLRLDRPFPVYPGGFPVEIIEAFERRTGRQVLGNVVASGTEIIARLGDEHVRTGRPIVYTSADSVFQIAAHESVVPVPELYAWCDIAFDIVSRGHGVGRVIARPFVGTSGTYTRTANRRDFVLEPFGDTLLDCLARSGRPVVSVGKIEDLFAGRGTGRAIHTKSDAAGMEAIARELASLDEGLIFANLVDSDAVFGHRNDPQGYAANLERFDVWLAGVLPTLRASDVLIVTADHGNDPTTPSTDHSREYVPLLATGAAVRPGTDLGVRSTFADLGQTLAELFGVGPLAYGTSFLSRMLTS